ncbi:DUF1127 domain-containing protein [Mesorhizobium tianshanense]|uniref:DUF1127 domain-containing protein n=1 Tax=Mesorhizobium tianshanense TaxID=39844 RepID=A0A562MAA5_9HYPH|nr:DUF1127 domain-containing protein [Mesorhizobium tianshanense]TWI16833.1 hypothetical protein IQ26_07639 [Mesorhizobium tianshanense]
MVIIHAAAIGPFRRWLRLRAERKALLSATDQLSRLPDDVLGDIGISCDEIMCALRSRAIRHAEAGAAGTTIERTRSLRPRSRNLAGSGYASDSKGGKSAGMHPLQRWKKFVNHAIHGHPVCLGFLEAFRTFSLAPPAELRVLMKEIGASGHAAVASTIDLLHRPGKLRVALLIDHLFSDALSFRRSCRNVRIKRTTGLNFAGIAKALERLHLPAARDLD